MLLGLRLALLLELIGRQPEPLSLVCKCLLPPALLDLARAVAQLDRFCHHLICDGGRRGGAMEVSDGIF